MIFTSQNPLSPDVEITVFGVDFEYIGIQRIILEMGESKHDSLRMLVSGIASDRITEFLTAPVQIKWSHDDQAYEFTGYITYIEPEHTIRQGPVKGSPIQLATIHCLGSSSDMRKKRNNVWNDVTINTVIAQIAARYRYSFACPRDGFVFARLVQSGESDWEFLTRMAHQLGYSVTAHGTHLHVFDRYKAYSRRTSFTQLTVPGRTSDAKLRPGQVIEMSGALGFITPDSNVNEETLSVLDNRGNLVTLRSGKPGSGMGKNLPPQFTDDLASTSLSASYGQRKLRQRARKKFPFKAHLSVTGISGILPGGVIDLQDFDSQFDGFWYVTDVTQTLSRDRYLTELTVIKDSFKGKPRQTGTARAKKPPRPILRGKRWQAAKQQGIQYE